VNAEGPGDLLIRALEMYRRVVTDPMGHAAACADLLTAARHGLRDGKPPGAEALVAALRASAWLEHARMANRVAKDLLDEAADLARRHRLDVRMLEVLVSRAAVHLELGEHAAARKDLVAALGDGGELPPELGLQQASLYYNTGELRTAAQLCRRVLADPAAPVELRAKVTNNLAVITAELGSPDDALRLLDTADELASAVAPALVAAFASSRGWVLAQAGRLAESMRQFSAAEDRYAAAGLPTAELLLEQLDALVDLRLLPEALALAERAVAELGADDVALMRDDARYRAARVALLAGHADTAHELARDVAAEFRRQRRPGWTARAEVLAVRAAWEAGRSADVSLPRVRRAACVLDRLGLRAAAVDAHLLAGRVALARSRRPVALEHLDSARRRAARGSVLVRLQGRLAAALAAQAAGNDRDALRHSQAGLATLSRHRAALGSMELRALASGHGAELGQIGLGVLLRSGSAAAVLQWMERTRAASLLTVAPPAGPEVRAQLAALAAVQAELEAARRDGSGEPRALLARQRELEGEVRRSSWREPAPGDPSGGPVGLGAARALLGGRTAVAFGSDGESSFAVVLGARTTRLVPLGPVARIRAESDAVLFALRRLTRPGPERSLQAARAGAEHGLRELHALLLAPLGLAPDVPLVVLPDVVTRNIAWSALHPAPTSVTPSLSLWARSAPDRPRRDGSTVLVAGPDLPGATQEVAALAAQHPAPVVLTPPDGTVAAVTDALAGADLAHFACHGLLRLDNPTFSALRLYGGDLSLHQRDLLGCTPARVVLAACDSAAGAAYDGDEVLGFVGALMARGTRGLVASIAPIVDLEAVELNTALHAHLLSGATMAVALHRARSATDRDDPRGFLNWCAATAYGAA
jgi:tetratricopeptide (TPR) repeat protein